MNNYFMYLKKYLLSQKIRVIVILICTIIQSGVSIIIPYIYKILIDDVFPKKQVYDFYCCILILFVGFISNFLFSTAKDYFTAVTSEMIAKNIKSDLNIKLNHIEYRFYDNHTVGDIVSKYNKEIDIIKNNFGVLVLKAFGNILIFLGACLMIFKINKKVMILSIFFILIYALSNILFGKKINVLSHSVMRANGEVVDRVTDNYNTAILSRIYNLENYVKNKFQTVYNKYFKTQIKFEFICCLNINLSIFIIYMLAIIIWLIGGQAIFNGSISIGSIILLINYQGMLLSPVNFFCEFGNSYNEVNAAIKRLEDIMNEKEERKNGIILNQKIEQIEVKNLEFSYNKGKPIISKLCMKINKGQIVGIYGSSGCGKSTLIKLLLGLYAPTSGEIYFNDYRLSELNLYSVREKISAVMQDSLFYMGTIAENILFDEEDVTQNCVRICKSLDIYNEIVRMQDQWDTELTSNASNLSGGQKKRLDLVRALTKAPDILILDESTSPLDEERRRRLYDTLQSIKKEMIIIVITHNNDYEIFDKIINLNEYREGTYEKNK